MGKTKEKIKEAFDKLENEKGIKVNISFVEDLNEAINKARSLAQNGDVITLSPACASFDMFLNFAARGNLFKELVNELK